MKNWINRYGILLLIVSGLIYTSCDKGDDDFHPIELQYAIFNDKPNPVTNNQVTINFPDETKTELVILGGDGTYSISNSDDNKLSISRIDGCLTLTALAPGNAVVTVNDSRNNSYTLKVQIKSQLIVKMNAREKAGNIFDLMAFNLFAYSDKDVTLLDLTEAYDSLVWTCCNTDQRFRILEHSSNSTHFVWEWSNCFFQPAEYETCLLGYKNNRVISVDTVKLNITNNRDFLGYNWKDFVRTSRYNTGYQDVFQKGYDFVTYSAVTEGVPSVCLYLADNSDISNRPIASKSKQILYDYICSLYSAPTYSQDHVTLSAKYNELFRNKRDGAVPECIWLTQKSKIVLLKEYDESANNPKYEIYAEPV